jgi:NADH dehydrogenase
MFKDNMRIFLTGGTGFVGTHLLRRLLRDGHEVRALRRTSSSVKAEQGFESRLKMLEGDISSPDLISQVAGCDAVIHLVGIIMEQGTSTFEAVHHLGTRNVAQAARAAGVKRFVLMSALGARPGDASRYHTTKFAAEEEVRKSGMPFTILRPSLIVGEGSAFVEQMVKVMRSAPLVRPIPGTGKYLFRPVYIDDVVECFTQSLTNHDASGQTVNLVGGEELNLDEIGREIAACIGIRKRAVHIPMALMKAAAALFSILPVTPPVNSVQLRMMEEGSTADPAPMIRIFGIQPVGFRQALRKYLCPSTQ